MWLFAYWTILWFLILMLLRSRFFHALNEDCNFLPFGSFSSRLSLSLCWFLTQFSSSDSTGCQFFLPTIQETPSHQKGLLIFHTALSFSVSLFYFSFSFSSSHYFFICVLHVYVGNILLYSYSFFTTHSLFDQYKINQIEDSQFSSASFGRLDFAFLLYRIRFIGFEYEVVYTVHYHLDFFNPVLFVKALTW